MASNALKVFNDVHPRPESFSHARYLTNLPIPRSITAGAGSTSLSSKVITRNCHKDRRHRPDKHRATPSPPTTTPLRKHAKPKRKSSASPGPRDPHNGSKGRKLRNSWLKGASMNPEKDYGPISNEHEIFIQTIVSHASHVMEHAGVC